MAPFGAFLSGYPSNWESRQGGGRVGYSASMEFIYNLVVILHFIGLASLVGGFIVQMKSADKGVNAAMFHGALTQLVTGFIMVGMVEGGAVDDELDMTKISVKLGITIVVTGVGLHWPQENPTSGCPLGCYRRAEHRKYLYCCFVELIL